MVNSDTKYLAGSAVDGDTNTYSYTKREANPWLKIDIAVDSIVYKVKTADLFKI